MVTSSLLSWREWFSGFKSGLVREKVITFSERGADYNNRRKKNQGKMKLQPAIGMWTERFA
jgi:hypothetical protein